MLTLTRQIFKDQKPNFERKIFRIKGIIQIKTKLYSLMKSYSQICALSSRYQRHSEKLTVNCQMTKKLTANRQNDLFLTVNRQMDSFH